MPMLNLLSNGLYRHGIIPLDRFRGGMLYRSPVRLSIERMICLSHALVVLNIYRCSESKYTSIFKYLK